MDKILIHFPASGETFDVTNVSQKELEKSRQSSFEQKVYSWIIYINNKYVEK